MKRQRIVLTALGTTLAASAAACGSGTPTASELGLEPSLNVEGGGIGSGNAVGGVGMGSGNAAGGGWTIGSGGVMGGTGTGGSTEPADTTKRIGFIGSGG